MAETVLVLVVTKKAEVKSRYTVFMLQTMQPGMCTYLYMIDHISICDINNNNLIYTGPFTVTKCFT